MRERLTERVKTRLVDKGTPEKSADRQSVNAVDNYYSGVQDEHSDLVAAEACREFADHLMLRAPRMAEAWEYLAQMRADLDRMNGLFTGVAMSLGTDEQRNALASSVNEASRFAAEGLVKGLREGAECASAGLLAAALDFGDDSEPTNAPPDDVITGWPDHHIVNGDPLSCGCPEHLAAHKAAHPEIYTGHTSWCATQGGHAGTDCAKYRSTCTHNPPHVYGARCPRG